MTTILAKKAVVECPIATDDEAHALLIADPSMPQFGPTYNFTRPGTTNFNQSVSATPVLTGASPTNAASGADVLVKADEHWINKHWRPMMGYVYMVTCITDFIIFPVLWSLFQAQAHGQVTLTWQPLTLQGAGLYHLAMGAVLGIAAYGRTKEKIEMGSQ